MDLTCAFVFVFITVVCFWIRGRRNRF